MIPGFFNLGTGEILIIVFVILLLFGGKKIPELMKGLGKGVRSFKQGMNDITDEINSPIDLPSSTKANVNREQSGANDAEPSGK